MYMRQSFLKKYTVLIARTGQTPVTLSFTPLSAAFALVLIAGIPIGWLSAVMFSLFNNNVTLSQQNRQLSEKAYEVINELDSLDAEIETLQERAGLPEQSAESQNNSNATVPPRGGEAKPADALSLFELAKSRMPRLNRTLDTSVKPALEETLAKEEARADAFPNGKPLTIGLDVSSEFGPRPNPFGGRSYELHEGIDFKGPVGTPIVATADGQVKTSGYNGGYGYSVVIDHGYGYESLYAHMTKTAVNAGETVKRGEIVGYLGSTGRSSGPHLHYGIYRDGQAVNPRIYLKLDDVGLPLDVSSLQEGRQEGQQEGRQ
jgi:murein DD-endopeptidase MepM/ murein hydrolase activator NlpD